MRSFVLAVALVLALAAVPVRAGAAPLTVAVTVEPQEYFLKKVGGDRVRALVLVPAGADPHVFEPRPGQMKALAGAAAWFTVGMEMEEAWLPRFRAVNPAMRVVPTDAGIAKLPMAGHEHGGSEHAEGRESAEKRENAAAGATAAESRREGREQAEAHEHAGEAHHHGLLDPHIWLSPALAKVQAAAMRDALASLDPEGAAAYAANWAAFAAECDVLSRDLSTLLAGLPSRAFMVFHPSWGYFARDLGLEQLAIEVEGKEPSPRDLARLVDEAREHGIRAIFVAPQFSRRTAGVVAREVKAGLVEADPLAGDWADNLRRVARSLAAAATRN